MWKPQPLPSPCVSIATANIILLHCLLLVVQTPAFMLTFILFSYCSSLQGVSQASEAARRVGAQVRPGQGVARP